MAFQPSNLALLTQGRGFGLWYYRQPGGDTSDAVTGAGYFSAARGLLRAGDLVLFSRATDGPDGVSGGIAAVAASASGVVDLADSMPVPLQPDLGGATSARCKLNRLAVLAYANGFTLWHYRSEDDAAESAKAGYWSPARGLLHPGDFIFGRYGAGAARRWGYNLILANNGTSVAVGEVATFS